MNTMKRTIISIISAVALLSACGGSSEQDQYRAEMELLWEEDTEQGRSDLCLGWALLGPDTVVAMWQAETEGLVEAGVREEVISEETILDFFTDKCEG